MPKPITDPFVQHACELLSGLGPCVARRMFGGWGISVDGMNIALIAWGTLDLKPNAGTEAQWQAATCKPFIDEAKGKPMRLNDRTPPAAAMESPALTGRPSVLRTAGLSALGAARPRSCCPERGWRYRRSWRRASRHSRSQRRASRQPRRPQRSSPTRAEAIRGKPAHTECLTSHCWR